MNKLADDQMILLPVRLVLFPGIVLPIVVGRGNSIAAAQEAARKELPLGVVLQRDPTIETPGPEDLYRIGTVANLLRYLPLPTVLITWSARERNGSG